MRKIICVVAYPNYIYAPGHEVIQLDTFSKLWMIAKSGIVSHQCKDKLLLYFYMKNYEVNYYFSQLQTTLRFPIPCWFLIPKHFPVGQHFLSHIRFRWNSLPRSLSPEGNKKLTGTVPLSSVLMNMHQNPPWSSAA